MDTPRLVVSADHTVEINGSLDQMITTTFIRPYLGDDGSPRFEFDIGFQDDANSVEQMTEDGQGLWQASDGMSYPTSALVWLMPDGSTRPFDPTSDGG